MNEIITSIRKRITSFCQSIAEAIDSGNWMAAICKIGLAGAIIGGVVVALVLLFALLLKLLGSFLGKLLILPSVLLVLGLSYKMNLEDSRAARKRTSDNASLEAWAEGVYEYVRDAMFLVLRTMSDYTVIVRPTSPGTIELPNGISIKDGYAVFSFFARVTADVDIPQLKRELARTLGQKLRAHELSGIAADLVQINGAYYCPLQILDVVDFGDSVNISVVFSTEKTVEVVNARRMFNPKRQVPSIGKKDTLYDDEL